MGDRIGFSWDDYLSHLVAETGSLSAVAVKLSYVDGTPEDPASIERALRRLRRRENRDGGEYGRRLLRLFGVPASVEKWTRWMGSYHSRFTDLPVSLCLDQLRVWDRPPVSESRSRAWLQIGFASCAIRQRDLEAASAHLDQARLSSAGASVEARLELQLLEAYLTSRRGDRKGTAELLERFEPALADAELSDENRLIFRARWLDQCAYQRSHPERGAPDLDTAERLYEAIPAEAAPPFVACKRAAGLAYVRWRREARTEASALARSALRHAGDAGIVRLRVAYLGLLAHIVDDGSDGGRLEAEALRTRAARLARDLEDEDLLHRLARRNGPPAQSVE